MSKRTAETPGLADLVALNRAATVARLLAGVAHDVNNALQVIGGTAELLQSAPGLPPSAGQGLQRITEQNARAASAISEVMMFARQKGDARGRVNLREIAARSAALRAFAIGRARLAIAVEPRAGGRFLVDGSAAHLQLAVLNLIVNAEQALAGRPGGAIHLGLEESDGVVTLQVSDNGPGVEAAVAASLFDPFVTTRPRDEASGLGLAVARLIAGQHGGTLTLEPSEAGASFALRLPGAR